MRLRPGRGSSAAGLPSSRDRDRDLGWMLHCQHIDFEHGRTPRFFQARLEGGVIDVPAPDDVRVKR